jgi:plasmid stability protein
MTKPKIGKSGFSFYKERGLEKALLIHLSKETHRKLRLRAFTKELSIQKAVRQIIEDAVKNEPHA